MRDVEIVRPWMNPSEWGLYGLAYMQVCAHGEVPPERIEQVANAENPSGVNTWTLTDKGPDDEDLSAVPCDDDPVRLHYMLSC